MTNNEIIKEIQAKLTKASTDELTAILAILNKSKPVPKKRATNAWVEYLTVYKAKHPSQSHNEAMANALKEYKAKPPTPIVVAPKVKVQKPQKVHICSVCEAEFNNKSNLNRHMKVKHSEQQIKIDTSAYRGLVRTHAKRLETTKDEKVRADSAEKMRKADELLDRIHKATALLTNKPVTKAPSTKTQTPVVTKAKKAKLPKLLIDEINKAFLENNKFKLNLKAENITSCTKDDDGDGYIVNVTNLYNDKEHEDKIDQMILTKDQMGYNLDLMQEYFDKRKGVTAMSNIDSLFVYEIPEE